MIIEVKNKPTVKFSEIATIGNIEKEINDYLLEYDYSQDIILDLSKVIYIQLCYISIFSSIYL